jgi:hypothetical protein
MKTKQFIVFATLLLCINVASAITVQRGVCNREGQGQLYDENQTNDHVIWTMTYNEENQKPVLKLAVQIDGIPLVRSTQTVEKDPDRVFIYKGDYAFYSYMLTSLNNISFAANDASRKIYILKKRDEPILLSNIISLKINDASSYNLANQRWKLTYRTTGIMKGITSLMLDCQVSTIDVDKTDKSKSFIAYKMGETKNFVAARNSVDVSDDEDEGANPVCHVHDSVNLSLDGGV